MSDMPNAKELMQQTTPIPASDGTVRLGTVTNFFPSVYTAKVKFDGESVASEKQYAYLDHYNPTVNDRVALVRAGGTWLIIGKISYGVRPYAAKTNGSGVVVDGTFNVNGTVRLNNSPIGFFGGTAASKTSVSDPTAITTGAAPASYNSTWGGQVKTDLTNLYNKLKALLDALQSYGLV